ncbi:MAG: xanthine dehydrogenase family protein subunit M [Gammaproteobacteria bacterium]|nr:xanthine dehydrogenase family protein subunit M [Gammaproteobacteria bacterium]
MSTEFVSAGSLGEALDWLASLGSDAAVLAGGTDLMLQLRRDEQRAGTLLHIERLRELGEVRRSDALAIGALVTHRKLARAPELRPCHGAICAAAALVGGWQTQNVGTVGGNLCNASPAADLVPPLLVHGARVGLESRARGRRELALAEFLLDRRRTRREPDELLTEVLLEPVAPRTADTFMKVGRRSAMEVAIASLALRLTLAPDDATITAVRVATGAVGPVACRAVATEALLTGARLGDAIARAAAAQLSQEIRPIDDARGSASYRRAVIGRVLVQALDDCAARIRARRQRGHGDDR